LDAYFARNLQQINYIFVLSVVVMLLGFVVMLVGVGYAVFVRGTSGVAGTGALLPTAAGLITQFIGATFLFVYRSTIQQAIRYVQTLERMNTVGMAMSVLDSLKQKSSEALSDKTKASIALSLLASYGAELEPSTDSDLGRRLDASAGQGTTVRMKIGPETVDKPA
jgi:hypothetical protein